MTGQCILVVDDDDTNRMVVRLLLERRGFEVLEAVGGLEAVALFAMRPVDLVLVDISLRGIDGFETTRQIRQLGPQGRRTPIVALTTHPLVMDWSGCDSLGVNGVLQKPFDVTAALHTIRALLETRVAGHA